MKKLFLLFLLISASSVNATVTLDNLVLAKVCQYKALDDLVKGNEVTIELLSAKRTTKIVSTKLGFLPHSTYMAAENKFLDTLDSSKLVKECSKLHKRILNKESK